MRWKGKSQIFRMLTSLQSKRKREGLQGTITSFGETLKRKSTGKKVEDKKSSTCESSTRESNQIQKKLDTSFFKAPEHKPSSNSTLTRSFGLYNEEARMGYEDEDEAAFFIDDDDDDYDDDGDIEGASLLKREDQRSFLAKSESFGTMIIDDLSMSQAMVSSSLGGLCLSNYYQEKFPFDVIADMITLGGQVDLPYCEIGMVINGKWWRNKIFENTKAFRSFVCGVSPDRLEIGPIHTLPYRGSKREFKINYRRHLVFDIDIEDDAQDKPGYIRWCECSGFKSSCDTCWIFVQVGLQVLNHLLKTAFGFKHLLKVYSGRRGAHVWVLDKKTVMYTCSQRQSVIDYINSFRNPSTHWDVNSEIIFREVILPCFKRAYLENNGLCHSEVSKYVSDRIPKEEARIQVINRWAEAEKSGTERWMILEEIIENLISKEMVTLFTRQVTFGLLWPKLDERVTTELNHLIKSPFVVHPGTNHVCIPIPDDHWVPSDVISKEMAMASPGVMIPYVRYATKVVKAAYGMK